MARRPNQQLTRTVEQEITYRAIPNSEHSTLLKIAKFVDGVEEEDNDPIVGSEEKLNFGGFFSKATFTVFVCDGFDKDDYRPFAMGVVGEDGFEHFVPNNQDARFYIGETEVFYDWDDRSWSLVDSDSYCYDDPFENDYYIEP